MLAIVHFFIELCVLRRKPQDLPASTALLGAVLLVGLLGGALLSVTAGASLPAGIGQTAVDLMLLLGALHVGLRLVDKPARFLQTATALVGADTLIGFLALVPVGLAGSDVDDSAQLLLSGLSFMALVAWSVVITAHILRHAFEIKLLQGAAIAVAYDLVSLVIVGGLTRGAA